MVSRIPFGQDEDETSLEMSATEQGIAAKLSFKKKTKRPKALWTKTFPEQHKALFPERTETGGMKGRSQAYGVRMAVYRPLAEMFKQANPLCQACVIIDASRWKGWTEDVHHVKGRDGLLLFDCRQWLAVCRVCHNWIHANPEKARQLKLLK